FRFFSCANFTGLVAGGAAMESPVSFSHFLHPGVLMNPINNVGQTSPLAKVTAAAPQKTTAADPGSEPSLADRVELSGLGHLLGALKNNDIRADKVASIKAQIAA